MNFAQCRKSEEYEDKKEHKHVENVMMQPRAGRPFTATASNVTGWWKQQQVQLMTLGTVNVGGLVFPD